MEWPPPYLTFLAYSFGNITEKEMLEMIDMWEEKHKEVER